MSHWDNIEFLFLYKFNIPPYYLELLEFYRVINILNKYEEVESKQQEEYEKQKSESEKQYANSYKPQMKIPGLPAMPKYNMPNIPKFK